MSGSKVNPAGGGVGVRDKGQSSQGGQGQRSIQPGGGGGEGAGSKVNPAGGGDNQEDFLVQTVLLEFLLARQNLNFTHFRVNCCLYPCK